MTIFKQKIITSSFICLATLGGFESLVYILNLNQVAIFLHVAFWLSLYFVLMMAVLFDLHFKKNGAVDLKDRLKHCFNWKYLAFFAHYAIAPGLVFWATVAVLYVNLGQTKIQQMTVFLSSLALILNFWYMKEVFHKQMQKLERNIFIPLSIVKIYASFICFLALFFLVNYICLDSKYFFVGVFLVTFSLIYQALFQHRLVSSKNLLIVLCIAFFCAWVGYLILAFWGFNYFTAAAILTIMYNFSWGVFHFHLDHSITWKNFFEILFLSLAVGSMLFSVTNFKARLLPDCEYGRGLKNYFK